MKNEKLFEFYEKLYFHEMRNREGLFTRVQINFALVFTGVSLITYMLRMLDFSSSMYVSLVFVFFALASLLLVAFSVFYLVHAFWGTEYKGVPSPAETDTYRNEVKEYAESILEYNRNYPDNKQSEVDVDELISQFVYKQLRDCATFNTQANESRFTHLHNSVRYLLIAAIPFLFASLLFVTFDLDASSPRKELLVNHQSLVNKLDSIAHEIRNASVTFNSIDGNQKKCQINQSQALQLLLGHLENLSQEESSKTENHQRKCKGNNMSDKKSQTPPPPPKAPEEPIAHTFRDDQPKKVR